MTETVVMLIIIVAMLITTYTNVQLVKMMKQPPSGIDNETWDAWFAAGLIAGDPTYYKRGYATPEEVKEAVEWVRRQLEGTKAL